MKEVKTLISVALILLVGIVVSLTLPRQQPEPVDLTPLLTKIETLERELTEERMYSEELEDSGAREWKVLNEYARSLDSVEYNKWTKAWGQPSN